MNYLHSRLDLHRFQRLGMVEAIWGEHKTVEQLVEILESLKKLGKLAFVTRVNQEKAGKLIDLFKTAQFHEDAHCLTLGDPLIEDNSLGMVVILSGGTSDLKVAAEAELALRWHGIKTKLLLDVGVAGLHRLLSSLKNIEESKVLIACAGMEGALPTVLAGLMPQPVIGVPVSVGYGVSEKGNASLNGMLASCAPGLSVVNIDNGYGAAMAALRILKCNRTSSSKCD
ncbi:nickel pincer cofactor biosynthesis protein LarB [Prochlorococcus sp. MIT 1223]|uniref:nickel pincer cofactor biosynthesis protein LarB n=1 Tax=Prochlorococcus sp. MIT 1223 TaxID=3096217 RepID=UPI002A75884A|nr:nickel pincer cofactor biosynthesis protein LarB [Prochlorococcus sp. MIT 1223]